VIQRTRRYWLAAVFMALASALVCGCTPYRSKQEKLQAHFAVGSSWPDAITTIEKALGPAAKFGGTCTTDLGFITFSKLPQGEYLLTYPTRGAGAPGSSMPPDTEAFSLALTDAFVHSRCTHAELLYDQYVVALEITNATIASAKVSRGQ
jgi:hypothetical protein